jgi:glutamate dehydrogenase
VPRERYDSDVRARIGRYLAEVYKGHVSAFYPSFPEGALTRVHFIIGRSGGETPNPDRATLEQAITAIVRTWTDALDETLMEAFDSQQAQTLFERYRDAFSEGYREVYSPLNAVADIRDIEALTPKRPLGVEFYHRVWDEKPSVGLKVWSHRRRIALSERVPVLENMGFRVVDEQTYHVASDAPDHPGTWLHDMALERADGQPAELDKLKNTLESCFVVVMRGFAENDGYNALVMAAGLGWRDVALIRTVSRFLRQIRVSYSQGYMWATLRKHAALAEKVVELFHARFDPHAKAADRSKREATIAAEMEEALKAVESLDEDRIVRHFINAVQSAIRTNYYQLGKDGQPKPEISIKFESRKLDGVPKPAPLYEIFVYSPRFEAVHLRFGKVARGGIRWSDRPQDFRTEILGLVKAQQVKNAVIVPFGSKGGYVPKRMPVGGAREALQAEGTATYKLFMQSLLDITDNLDLKGVVPPDNVVRHDSDDPYLVVAADKGTATFSDIANGIS